MKFIHLTDCHVISGGRTLYGADPVRRLARAVDSINAEHADAACVVVSGDLTHWGEAGAYAAFAAEIDRLSMPVHLMVGNHDDRAAFARAFAGAPRDAAGFVQAAIDTPAGRFLLLDTKAEGTHAGAYCAARRDWLRQQLDRGEGPVFLFMHHPPFAVGIRAMDVIALTDAEAFHEVIAPHMPRIRHLFFGHVHRPISGNWRGLSFSCMRGLNHQVALALDPAAPGFAGDFAEPAYGVVLIDEDCVRVHLHEFAGHAPRFELYPPDRADPTAYQLGMTLPGLDDF